MTTPGSEPEWFQRRAHLWMMRAPRAAQLTRVLQDLALARGLDEDAKRALNVARVALEHLLSPSASPPHVEMILAMHAIARGSQPGREPSADLREVAERVESVLTWPADVADRSAMRAKILQASLRGLGSQPGNADAIDLAWLAGRLDDLEAERGKASRRSALSLHRVVAEIAWKAGAHGAAERKHRPQYEGDEARALADFTDAVRKALR